MNRRFRRPKDNIYWGAIILDWFKYLRDNDLTSSDYKILFFLCEKMDRNTNKIHLKQKQLAQELSMDPGNISKSIKRLYKQQFITKCSSGFMINPHLLYVGKSRRADREELREIFDELLINNGSDPLFNLNEDDNFLEKMEQTNINIRNV